jgi:CheY-like chemotaxis protein
MAMALQPGLIQLVQRLSFCRDSEEVMAVLRDSARHLTGADGLTVVLRDGDLCHYVEEDAIAPLWKGLRFPLQACISGWCMLNRQQVAIPDIYADARVPHEAYRPTFVKSLAMTPIRSEDPIGAIGLYWARHHQAGADEMEVLQALGDSAAMAFANIGMIEELREANRRKEELLSMGDAAAGAAKQGPRHVLVVEDNRDAAESLRLLLEIWGYGVTIAYTGPDGVAAAQTVRPDVVLCDIGLPGMDGFTVAGILRRLPETASARLIAVTGYGQDEDRRRALEAGFDVHLVKPVDPEKLLGHLL